MAWETPKTDWQSTDCFNIEDYNRIRHNITIIYDMARTVFNVQYNIYNMGSDMSDYSGVWSADVFTNIGWNLEIINQHSYNLDIGQRRTYTANGPFIDFIELNRIESATLTIYNLLLASYNALPRLAFIMGQYRELRV